MERILKLSLWGFLGASGLAQGEVQNRSLLDLPLSELINVRVTTTSLYDSTLAESASWVDRIEESQWRRNGARRTLDALSNQPATLVMPYIAGGDIAVVRGYARTSSNRGVALLWDGVPMTDLSRASPTINLPNINLFNLSSIEYVQGPGSALHGSDAFHGVIGLNSYSPRSGRAAVELQTGENSYYQAGVRNQIALGDDYHASIALAANGQGNQHQNVSTPDPLTGSPLPKEQAQRYDADSAVVQLESKPAAATHYEAGYYHHRYEASGFMGLGPRARGLPDEGGNLTDLNMGRLGLSHQFDSKRSLELRGYYWEMVNKMDFNLGVLDGTLQALQLQRYDQHRFGAQAIYRDQLDALNTRWALEYSQDSQGVDEATFDVRANSGALLQQGHDVQEGIDRRIDSLVFEAQTDLPDPRWQLVWGARQDNYSDFGHQRSPRAGLLFQPLPEHTFKLLYSEAFRAPCGTEMKGNAGLVLENPNLQPEITDTIELIWLRQQPGSATQLSLFDSRWHNGIVTIADTNTGTFTYQNQENNRSHGITARHRARWQQWELDAGGSWVKSRNETLNQDYTAFPRYQFNLGIGYLAPSLRTDFFLQQRLMLDQDAAVQGQGESTRQRLPHYWRTDLSALWHVQPSLEAELAVLNLFDRGNRFPSITNIGGVNDLPFSLSAGLRYRWD